MELHAGIEPTCPDYKTGASPFMLMERANLAEVVRFELTLICVRDRCNSRYTTLPLKIGGHTKTFLEAEGAEPF